MTKNAQELRSRLYWDQRKERVDRRELEEGRVEPRSITKIPKLLPVGMLVDIPYPRPFTATLCTWLR